MNNETNYTLFNNDSTAAATTTSFITNLSNGQTSIFDRHTIILVSAFLVGLLSIGFVILLALCCCKSSMCKKRKQNKNEEEAAENDVMEMEELKPDLKDNESLVDSKKEEEKESLLKDEQIVPIGEIKDPSPAKLEPKDTESKKNIPAAVVAASSNASTSSTVTMNSISKSNSTSSKSFAYNKSNNKQKSLAELNKVDDRRWSKHGPVQTAILRPTKSINFSDQQSRRSSRISVGSLAFDTVDKQLDEIINGREYRDDSSNNDLNSRMNSATDIYTRDLEKSSNKNNNNDKSEMNSTSGIFDEMKTSSSDYNHHSSSGMIKHSKSRERLGKNTKSSTSINSFKTESEKSCY